MGNAADTRDDRGREGGGGGKCAGGRGGRGGGHGQVTLDGLRFYARLGWFGGSGWGDDPFVLQHTKHRGGEWVSVCCWALVTRGERGVTAKGNGADRQPGRRAIRGHGSGFIRFIFPSSFCTVYCTSTETRTEQVVGRQSSHVRRNGLLFLYLIDVVNISDRFKVQISKHAPLR